MSEQDTRVEQAGDTVEAERTAEPVGTNGESVGAPEQAAGAANEAGTANEAGAADEAGTANEAGAAAEAGEPADWPQSAGDATAESGKASGAASTAAPDEDVDAGSGSGQESGGKAERDDEVARLEHEGEVAADFLERLLDIADLDGDIDVDVEGDRASVAIVDSDEGRVPRRLVGPDGRVLEALQELTRLAVQASTGDRSRLMLDIAGHRAGRRAELVEVAQTAIEHVRASGEAEELEPMSAFERKVVHDEVLAAGLVSESEGTEPNRYVVVLPAGQAD
ncbi:protein jag [Segeticoccus sp.]|uniref:Jag family protein n=1 Tax=Segeticoccus sp. TaxID=2706531 RepID=UPI0039C92EFC